MQKKAIFPLPKKPTKMRRVYLDYAAASPMSPHVLKTMAPFLAHNYANPSALYSLAQTSREAVSAARQIIANSLFTQPDTIIFTGSGTEANNLAILGSLPTAKSKKAHIITTSIEHHSVLEPIKALERQGVKVTYIPVNNYGDITVKDVMAAIRPETILISIMYANNEIGTINPIAAIGRELLKYRKEKKTATPYFHVDGCQAAGTLDLHTERLHADLMTINGSKIYGPKGVGALFVRRGVPLKPIIYGGGQESGQRSGTENVPGIVGLAKALTLAQTNSKKETARLEKLRDYFLNQILKKIPDTFLNGPRENRLANNINICFKGVEGETLVLYLDAYGIYAATGSACATETGEASHVLIGCGLDNKEAKSSVRFTLGKDTSKGDIDYVMKFLPQITKAVRHYDHR